MYLAQTPQAPTSSPSLVDMLQTAVPAAMQAYRERKAIKLQMERARQGLPPLPLEQYSPPIRVQGGLDQQTMLLAGLGIAGALGLVLLMGRRRRRA